MMGATCRTSWRYVVILLFTCCYSLDAFAPALPYSSQGLQSNAISKVTSSMIPASSSPRRVIPGQYQTTTLRMSQINEEDESGISTSKDIPSSPLDRPILSGIDAIALLIFAGIGKASHSADGSLDIGAVLVTAFPFLISWFLISPLVGSYTPDATRDVKSATIQAAKGWILAIPMGCVLRGVIKGYIPPLPFVVVTMISTLIILCLGRAGYTFLSEIYVELF